MSKGDPTIAALGCTGPVSRTFVTGFLELGAQLRILARDPAAVAARFPEADIVEGSMAQPDDVARVIAGVDAAFLMTPMGMCDDPAPEVKVAEAVIAGAQSGELKHLIYPSVLGADRLRGVGILDAKYEIEKRITASGVPHTILRCGSYMEDVFDPRLALLNRGIFLFPINKERRFRYTSQRDVPRFVVEMLRNGSQPLNRAVNFVEPTTYSVCDVEENLSNASGRGIRAPSKFPTYYLFWALLPYFNLTRHRFSSILPLMRHFDRCGYTDTGEEVGSLFPGFRMTTLEEHFRALWPSAQ